MDGKRDVAPVASAPPFGKSLTMGIDEPDVEVLTKNLKSRLICCSSLSHFRNEFEKLASNFVNFLIIFRTASCGASWAAGVGKVFPLVPHRELTLSSRQACVGKLVSEAEPKSSRIS